MCRPPKVLYRYLGVSGDRLEWIRELLVESKLFFTSYKTFNDPLDCRSVFLCHDASSLKITQYWRNLVRREFPRDPLRNHKQRISELVGKTRTEEGRKELRERTFRSLERHGIVCLSTQPDNMLMWSHYAEGHKGVVVRFNMNPVHLAAIVPDYLPIEVQYSTEFPRMNYYEDSMSPVFFARLVGTKAKAWEHEREWRIVLPDQRGHIRIPPRMIDAVILGLRTDTDCEQKIRAWVQDRSALAEVLRIAHESDSFQLKVVPA